MSAMFASENGFFLATFIVSRLTDNRGFRFMKLMGTAFLALLVIIEKGSPVLLHVDVITFFAVPYVVFYSTILFFKLLILL